MQNDQIRRRNAYMEAACFRGHRRSHPKGAYRASALQFWEFPFIMRPSSLGGGRIMRRTLSVRLSVCLSVRLSVRPSRYLYRASRGAT